MAARGRPRPPTAAHGHPWLSTAGRFPWPSGPLLGVFWACSELLLGLFCASSRPLLRLYRTRRPAMPACQQFNQASQPTPARQRDSHQPQPSSEPAPSHQPSGQPTSQHQPGSETATSHQHWAARILRCLGSQIKYRPGRRDLQNKNEIPRTPSGFHFSGLVSFATWLRRTPNGDQNRVWIWEPISDESFYFFGFGV